MLLPQDAPLRLLILMCIDGAEKAPKEEERHPTRYSIIAELCQEFCTPKLTEFKSSKHRDTDGTSLSPAELRNRIVSQTQKLMRELEKEFKELVRESPPRMVWNQVSGEVKLTDEGRKIVEDASKPKSDPT